ncbi:unnamed protein product, partial [Meganyctiphanes norvegica]
MTTLDVTVISIRTFDLLEQKLDIDILMVLEWNDPRLNYANLNNQSVLNYVQNKDDLWIPKLYITDDTQGKADRNERSSIIVIVKQANQLPNNLEFLSEDLIYSGSDNPLILTQEQTVSFQCQFDLGNYPFDDQTCSLTFTLAGVDGTMVNLLEGKIGAIYNGTKILPEYEV